MAVRKKRESREQRRYTRNATKQGFVLRRPAHPGRILAVSLSAVGVIILALIWGRYLKEQSDEYRAAQERGEWTLDPETAVAIPVDVPDMRALAVSPGGNVGDILIEASHEGVIFSLTAEDGTLAYRSFLGEAAGLPTAEEAIPLDEDVARVKKRGLRVVCAYEITWHTVERPADRIYRRGMELALLRECAEAGVDEILLFGLPSHGETLEMTSAFLCDLRESLSDLKSPPAIGVALSATAFLSDGEDELYVGNTSTAHIRKVCDYLAMDLRARTAEEMAELLPRIQYAYVRYSLRLLTDAAVHAAAEEAFSHGFERVYEMENNN